MRAKDILKIQKVKRARKNEKDKKQRETWKMKEIIIERGIVRKRDR